MVAGWPLAVLRIVFGLMYLDMALQKAPWLVSGGRRYGWLYGWIQQEIAIRRSGGTRRSSRTSWCRTSGSSAC